LGQAAGLAQNGTRQFFPKRFEKRKSKEFPCTKGKISIVEKFSSQNMTLLIFAAYFFD
jgi:hypothetical protein